jgi:hypothetical protein
MADDDEDMGTTFMRQHMSEAQTSTEAGALGNKSRSSNPKGSDGYYSDKYGKDVDLSGDSKPVVVNREDKASRSNTGAIGTDSFYSQKYGGDGITGGKKPTKSQQNKTLKYD